MDSKKLQEKFTHHPPFDTQLHRYGEIREKALELARLINAYCPESPEKEIAINRLQETSMWANASIAINEWEGL